MCCACRTMADEVVFVPYGKTVNDDAARIQYMSDMKGYSKTRLLPGFDIYEQAKGSLPQHLQNVRLGPVYFVLLLHSESNYFRGSPLSCTCFISHAGSGGAYVSAHDLCLSSGTQSVKSCDWIPSQQPL